jgi:hypothetical protein
MVICDAFQRVKGVIVLEKLMPRTADNLRKADQVNSWKPKHLITGICVT